MKKLLIIGCTLPLLMLAYCSSSVGEYKAENTLKKDSFVPDPGIPFKAESRNEIVKRLSEKIKNKTPLVVHAFVPLCDNENQGIVPVNAQLGDGMNLKTNLYWGAGYGVKSYFKLKTDWKLLQSVTDPHEDVLERVVFNKKFSNGAHVYLVADAYRGDRMDESLHDYFLSLSGRKKEKLLLNTGVEIPFYSDADMLVFNGHDGLMDDSVRAYTSIDTLARDAVIIACYSHTFFTMNEHLPQCGGYPLVTTSGLLAPEAYVLEGVINAWVMMKTDNEIRIAAGDAYHAKHPSTTQKGARWLFKTGW
ncbi:MAG: hypothetical protein ACOZCO_12610 [Bacteroidota bacterium]